ncbi:MAG: AGE family epimerase/isomerase [Lachnospiraceae bacterium]|jgi:N-acylglucosamine 2-epimerase|nr:AGE family epimerase/isomerase [Lachnospiraceae bacterium]
MNKKAFSTLQAFYRDQLLDDCIPFWLNGGLLDKSCGGYITSLTRDGKRYNTDKSVWFQGRGLWTFSALSRLYGEKEAWTHAAISGKDFLEKYCFDSDGRMFFTTTKEGLPLRKRRYMFSESFYVVGMAEYAAAFANQEALVEAEGIFTKMLAIYRDPAADPYKITPKEIASTRQGQAIAVPMVLISIAQVLLRANPKKAGYYQDLISVFAKEMLRFVDEDNKCVREYILSDGTFLDNPAGRTVNPGHSIENAWFLMNAGIALNDEKLKKQGLEFLDWSLEIGWDIEHGGILYFVDACGHPPEQLEHDMKLWWVHCEALVATLMAYSLTRQEQYWAWFAKLHQYCESHFHDREYGEWYGYLHRDGTVSHTQKGSLWKGPYHLPRALMCCERILGALAAGEPPIAVL